MSSPTCRWCGLSADFFASIVVSTRRSNARWRPAGGACFYLEKLRIFHALVTIILALGLLAWAIDLWQRGAATTGDVVLICTLALSVLHATRDLAVALVDITQHIARLSEALATLLVPHDLRDHPEASPLVGSGASVKFENVHFRYGDGQQIFENLNLTLRAGRTRWPGWPLGRRKVDAVRPAAALLRRAGRPHSDRRARHRAGDAGELEGSHRRRAAGYFAVSSICHGEHPLRQTGRFGRRGARGGIGGALRIYRGLARRHAHPGRRARRQAVWRTTAAHRHRAGLPEECASLLLDEATSALDSESEEAIRRSFGPADAWTHRHRHRSSVFDGTEFRPGYCAAARKGCSGRRAGFPSAARGTLPTTCAAGDR